MNIHHQEAKVVQVLLTLPEAQHVLEGLRSQNLGDIANALAQQLSDAGINPPLPADHIREEYMPPS